MFVASDEGHCDVVKCLLSSGAYIKLCDGIGQSPLFLASEEGHCDVVKCLLSSDAGFNFCDGIGQLPLQGFHLNTVATEFRGLHIYSDTATSYVSRMKNA